MPLLDVNALVALLWDSHVHHVAAREWFDRHHGAGWSTCPVTESGFVRVSASPALPSAVSVDDARGVLLAARGVGTHRFLVNDVSPCDDDVPRALGHREVTDAALIAVARRNGTRLVTFDAGVARLAAGRDVELLAA